MFALWPGLCSHFRCLPVSTGAPCAPLSVYPAARMGLIDRQVPVLHLTLPVIGIPDIFPAVIVRADSDVSGRLLRPVPARRGSNPKRRNALSRGAAGGAVSGAFVWGPAFSLMLPMTKRNPIIGPRLSG